MRTLPKTGAFFALPAPAACSKDSAERDRVATYLERVTDIVGIESFDGLLNRWRYGFDPPAD